MRVTNEFDLAIANRVDQLEGMFKGSDMDMREVFDLAHKLGINFATMPPLLDDREAWFMAIALREQPPAEPLNPRPVPPPVVVLCGSTRFFHEFQRANFELTMQGKIVLSVGFYAGSPDQMVEEHGEGVGITPEDKLMLDELHKRKIDLADSVLVLNVGGYIGESTRSEIEYAEKIGRPVAYLENGSVS